MRHRRSAGLLLPPSPTYAPSQLGGVGSALAATGYALPPQPAPSTGAYKPSVDRVVIAHTESGERNVTQSLGTKDINNNYGVAAGILRRAICRSLIRLIAFAPIKMGIDTNQYPWALLPARSAQIAVASTIPFNQWGGATKGRHQGGLSQLSIFAGRPWPMIQVKRVAAPCLHTINHARHHPQYAPARDVDRQRACRRHGGERPRPKSYSTGAKGCQRRREARRCNPHPRRSWGQATCTMRK